MRIDCAARFGLRTETRASPRRPSIAFLPLAAGRNKSRRLISMAARCAHAGPTSRRTRQSRLPDREAARGRRGLDGRRAVVARIYRGAPAGLHCGRCHDLSLAWHLQCVGCDKKNLWPSVGLSLGLIGTCWYFFGLIGSRWYVVAFGGNGHQTDHRGLRSFAPGWASPH